MDGTIIHFDAINRRGIVRGGDGKRYTFAQSDWRSDGVPFHLDTVDFEPDGNGAADIFLLTRSKSAETLSPPAPATSARAVEPAESTVAVSPNQAISGTAGLAAASITSPALAGMPTGNAARYFVAYFIVMVPTYILPYFGSNSLIANGLMNDAFGALPPPFWWHFTALTLLAFIGYVRGLRIARGWLVVFPIIAGLFDLVPIINNIPFVPTVMHLAALYVGTSRQSPSNFDMDSVRGKTQVALWSVAALMIVGIYKVLNFPGYLSSGSNIGASLMMWPVLIGAVIMAIRQRNPQAAVLPTSPSLPEQTGDADAMPPQTEPTASVAWYVAKPWLASAYALAAIGLAAAIVLGLTHRNRSQAASSLAAANAAGTAIAMDPMGSAQSTLYVRAAANIRSDATAIGTNIVGNLVRGEQVTGVIMHGTNSDFTWLQLADGRGFVSMINLSDAPAPPLAQQWPAREWVTEGDTPLHSTPQANSDIVETIANDTPIMLSGVTTTGWAEAKRPGGGVGYFLLPDSAVTGTAAASATSQEPRTNGFGGQFVGNDRNQSIQFIFGNAAATTTITGYAVYESKKTTQTCYASVVQANSPMENTIMFSQAARPGYPQCSRYEQIQLNGNEVVRDSAGQVQSFNAHWVGPNGNWVGAPMVLTLSGE